MTTTLDASLRQIRRDAMISLGKQHDEALAKDVERTLRPENMEKLKVLLENRANYSHTTASSYADNSIIFSVSVRLIETAAFVQQYPHATISVPHGSFSFKDFRAYFEDAPHFYANHPHIKGVVDRMKEFCGPSTKLTSVRMAKSESDLVVNMWFAIPMSDPPASDDLCDGDCDCGCDDDE
jgi:hypothetical protein